MATEPDNPRRGGYAFEGWFADPELQKPFDFDTPIDGDTILYAKWTSSPCAPGPLAKVEVKTANHTIAIDRGNICATVYKYHLRITEDGVVVFDEDIFSAAVDRSDLTLDGGKALAFSARAYKAAPPADRVTSEGMPVESFYSIKDGDGDVELGLSQSRSFAAGQAPAAIGISMASYGFRWLLMAEGQPNFDPSPSKLHIAFYADEPGGSSSSVCFVTTPTLAGDLSINRMFTFRGCYAKKPNASEGLPYMSIGVNIDSPSFYIDDTIRAVTTVNGKQIEIARIQANDLLGPFAGEIILQRQGITLPAPDDQTEP